MILRPRLLHYYKRQIQISMDQRQNNGPTEGFFGTLKAEMF